MKRHQALIQILEKGHIYFFYRPRADAWPIDGEEDVSELMMLLHPFDTGKYRFIILENQGLPEFVPQPETYDGFQGYWGVVKYVEYTAPIAEDRLDSRVERTRFQGPVYLRNARPAGEGVYLIGRHQAHSHLTYILELPEEAGDVQSGLNIEEKEGNFLLYVKNPDFSSTPKTRPDELPKPLLPKEWMKKFNGQRTIPLESTRFLDYEGAEILLYNAGQEKLNELDPLLKPEHETQATAEIFTDLHMERERHPIEPLFAGRWF